jgi:succinate dehydrogenase / fumarate reductase flavoprotein subunit
MLEAAGPSARDINTAALVFELQSLMWRDVGPFRTEAGLQNALERIGELEERMGDTPVGAPAAFDLARLDWLDLRNMLLVARAVAAAALARTESRGAHQRDDYTGLSQDWTRNQIVSLEQGKPVVAQGPLIPAQEAA